MLRKIDKNSINVREGMEITITQAKLPPLITHQCIGAIISIYQAWYRFSLIYFKIYYTEEPSWSWSYGSWICNYICNQCLSPLTLCVWCVLETTLWDKVCQWIATGRWFYRHDITEIPLKVALNTIA